MSEVVTRAEAKARGLIRYFTGKPCKHGHVAERYVSTGFCMRCSHQDHKESDAARTSAQQRAERRRLRKVAKLAGETYYLTGQPCTNGHVAHRRTASGGCVECLRAANHRCMSDPAKLARHRANSLRIKREQRLADPETVNRLHREYLADNLHQRHRNRTTNKKWREENRTYIKQKMKEWNQANPEKAQAARARRRAIEKGAAGSHTAADRLAILAAQKYRCAECRCGLKKDRGTYPSGRKRPRYHMDHIIPLVAGGTDDRCNLQALCPSCNHSKGAKDPVTFARELGRLL